jgi:hypothetical protein
MSKQTTVDDYTKKIHTHIYTAHIIKEFNLNLVFQRTIFVLIFILQLFPATSQLKPQQCILLCLDHIQKTTTT